jgi:hypothetical protein
MDIKRFIPKVMAKYLKFPENMPPDAVDLWVDRSSYYGEPFKAQFTSGSQMFTDSANGIQYPAYCIVRWRLF